MNGFGATNSHSSDAIRRIQRVQTVTIAWMSVEAAVSLFAAWRASSPALLAFGGDSAIELFSAVVVLWRFRATAAHEDAERRAARVAGALLFALAAFVAITSVASLLGYSEPKPTFLGIAILVAAAAVMPWLAKEKRRLSGATGSAALRADAAQSALCAYLSLIALAGLAINAIWHVKWADPVAALAVLPLIVWEGRKPCAGRLAAVADLSVHDHKKLDYASETILFSTSDVLVKESENIGLPFGDSRVHEIVPVIRCATDRRINLQNVRLAEPRQFISNRLAGRDGVVVLRMKKHNGDGCLPHCRQHALTYLG